MLKIFRSRAADISNVTNSRRAEQAIKLIHETCIYSTAWLKQRLFSHHNFAACFILYCCFLANLVLIKVMMSIGPYKL